MFQQFNVNHQKSCSLDPKQQTFTQPTWLSTLAASLDNVMCFDSSDFTSLIDCLQLIVCDARRQQMANETAARTTSALRAAASLARGKLGSSRILMYLKHKQPVLTTDIQPVVRSTATDCIPTINFQTCMLLETIGFELLNRFQMSKTMQFILSRTCCCLVGS
jgi:hypothetical protein